MCSYMHMSEIEYLHTQISIAFHKIVEILQLLKEILSHRNVRV